MQGYMEILTMAEDERIGTDDSMLAPDVEKSQRRELSPGRSPPSAVPQQPAGPLDGLHVFTIFMAVVRWPPMGTIGHNSSG